jgi:gluconokinase
MMVVFMGVCSCGKSTIGRRVADEKDWVFIEGDDLHPEANRAKMASGTSLSDTDREPWLDRIAAEMRQLHKTGASAVVTCSALRRSYRDRLRTCGAPLMFVHLTGDGEVIRARMAGRTGHFMPTKLLDSQLATLEKPGPDENCIAVDVAGSADDMVAASIAAIDRFRP